jgi:hypothetical protein
MERPYYTVFDNNKSADYNGALSNFVRRDNGWDTASFKNLKDAVEYALAYLGVTYSLQLSGLSNKNKETLLVAGYQYSYDGDVLQVKLMQ